MPKSILLMKELSVFPLFLCKRGGGHGVFQQHRNGHRPNAPRHRCKITRHLENAVKIDIPHELTVRQTVHADVNDGSTRLYHIRRNKVRLADCHNKNIRLATNLGKIFCAGMANGHSGIGMQKQHGLRHIRFHDLRHSCASLLLSQGIPMKQIQEWLGHSTFATTADIYSHLDFNSKLESADAITAAFAEEKPAEEQEEDGFGMSLSM